MAAPAQELRVCPICSSELADDGVCLVCVFSDALDPELQTPVTSTFRPPATNGVNAQYRPFGKLALPCEFASHRLIREIAAGGMGVVYEADDLKLKRTVALKTIRSASHASVEERARFRAEAEAAARLEHPAIVPIYEIGEAEGLPYFTMRMIEGGSLAQKLAASPHPMSEKEAAAFMSVCARAVHHAHEHGVLHRDLTPGNILLTADGRPILTDFGIAKSLDSDLALTRTSAQLGTPHYMSPEQASGESKNITTASDIWSLGVILFQMVSLRLPFEGTHQMEIMQKVLNDEPTRLQDVRTQRTSGTIGSSVSTDFRTIVARCLEKNLSHRITSAAFLADELDRFVEGVPIQSRPSTAWMQIRKWVLRRPAVAGLIALCILLIAFSSVAIVWQWRSALQARDVAVDAQSRTSRVLYRSTIANAVAAVHEGQTGDARRLLVSMIPEPGAPDLRGPEWHMLRHLCNGGDLRRPDGTPIVGLLDESPAALGWLNTVGRFAIAFHDGRLEIWDPERMIRTNLITYPPLTTPVSVITSGTKLKISYSPNDEMALWSYASAIQCVDNKTKTVLFRDDLNKPDFGWLADGRFYLGERPDDHVDKESSAWIIDPKSGERQPLPRNIGAPLYVSPDDSLLCGSTLSGPVQVWLNKNWDSSPPDLTLNKQGRPNHIAVSPKHDMVAISSFSGTDSLHHLFLYSLPSGELLYKESGFEPVVSLQFHPKLGYLAIASDRPNWDFLSLDEEDGPKFTLLTRTGHNAGLRHLSLSAQGGYAMTLGADSQLLLWKDPLGNSPHSSTFVSPSVKGRTPVFGPSDDVFLVSATTGPRHYTYGYSHHVVRALANHQAFAWTSDSRLFTWLPAARSIQCVDYTTEDPSANTLWSIPCPDIPAEAMLIDGGLTSSGDKAVLCTTRSLTVLDIAAQTARTASVRGGSGRTGHNAIALSPGGSHAALVGFSLHPKMHPLDAPEKSVQLTHDGLQDISVAFCNTRKWLLAGNEDGFIRVWEQDVWQSAKESPGRPLHRWQTQIGPVTGIVVSPDGKTLYTSGDTLLKVWEIRGETIALRANFPVPSPRHWLRFSPDGHWLHHAGIGTPAERWPVSE